jgi:hypothetical protein
MTGASTVVNAGANQAGVTTPTRRPTSTDSDSKARLLFRTNPCPPPMALLATHPLIGVAIIAALARMTLHHQVLDRARRSHHKKWIETRLQVLRLTRRSICLSALTSTGGRSQRQERTCWPAGSKSFSTEKGRLGSCLGTLLMVFWVVHVVGVGVGRQMAAVDGASDGCWV